QAVVPRDAQVISQSPAQAEADVLLKSIIHIGHVRDTALRVNIESDDVGVRDFGWNFQVQEGRRVRVRGRIVEKIDERIDAGGIKVHRLASLDGGVQGIVDHLGAGGQGDVLKLDRVETRVGIEIKAPVAVATTPKMARAVGSHPPRIG